MEKGPRGGTGKKETLWEATAIIWTGDGDSRDTGGVSGSGEQLLGSGSTVKVEVGKYAERWEAPRMPLRGTVATMEKAHLTVEGNDLRWTHFPGLL